MIARALRLVLVLATLVAPGLCVRPAAAQAPATATATDALARARELIKNADYDQALEVLRAEIARPGLPTETLREAYLQLVKTYVFLGNDYKFRPQGREASNLNYRAARDQIAALLAIPALRDTRPEPATDYPPEMIGFFAEVRSRMFGGFRVIGLEPRIAVVMLDGDTLGMSDAGMLPSVIDLPVGPHPVAVRAPGYEDLEETITISPGATVERSYRLEKRRTATWYATRWGGAAVVVGGVVALLARGGSDGGPSPLPGPPPPP